MCANQIRGWAWLACCFLWLSLAATAQTKRNIPALDTNNVFTGSNQFSLGDILGPQPFAGLSGNAPNGSQTYCTDCQVLNPCQPGGLGAFAQKVNGTWQCGGSGSGGTPGGSNTQLQFNNSGFFSGSPNLTWVSPTLTLGQANVTTGQLGLASNGGGTTILSAALPGGGTATLPANTGTIAELNLPQLWTAGQTFNDLLVSNGSQTASLALATLGANRIYTIPDSGGNNSFQMQAGVVTNGDCVKFDANGNTVDAGSPCGNAGTPAGPLNAIQFNNSSSFGGSAQLTWVAPTLTLGQAGTATGQLAIAGASSGAATLTVPAVAGGTWTLRNTSDSVIGAATADVFTNKTFDTSGSGNVFKAAGIAISGVQGNNGLLQLSSGVATSGHCVKFDASGNTVDAGQACGTATPAGSAGQIQYNSGSALAASPNLTFSTATLTVGAGGSATGVLALGGVTSGTTSLTPAATASGTWTLRATTDNVVGAATTDTFTNKTFDTAGTGNVFKINGTQVSGVTGSGSSAVLSTSPTIGTSLTIGGTSNQLVFNGNTNAITISVGNPALARTYTLPDSGGNNKIALTAGALVTGDCAKFDASGNVVDAGAACGTSSPGGLTTQVQFNSTGSFGGSASLTWVSPTLTIGANGAATGILALAGATSGSVAITTVAAAGGTATFPNATGTVLEAASSLSSGQLAVASGAAALTGSANLTWSSPTLTIGAAGATTGQLALANATSGSVSLIPASGGGALTLPAVTATVLTSSGLSTNTLPKLSGTALVNSSLSDSGTAVTVTNPVTITLSSTTAVGLTLTLPTGSTSDVLDACGLNSLPNCFRVNYIGQAQFPAGTAVQNGGSFLIPVGVESSPATVGEVINNGTQQEIFNGSIWQHYVYAEIINSFTNQNKFTQPAAATQEIVGTAAASPTADFLVVNNSSATTQTAVGCQSGDTNCPAAFGIYAPAIATVSSSGAAGEKTFGAGTDQGVPSYVKGVSLEGPATVTPVNGFVLRLPGTEPTTGQVLASSGGCTTDICPLVWSNGGSGTVTHTVGALGASFWAVGNGTGDIETLDQMTSKYVDAPESAAPANPSAGNDRLYFNSTTHQITCLTSGGGNCFPTGSGTVTHTVAALTANFAAVGNGAADIETLDQMTSKYVDYPESAAPANPATGNERVYFDSTAHQLKCLTSTGGNCAPAGSAGANQIVGGYCNGTAPTTTFAVFPFGGQAFSCNSESYGGANYGYLMTGSRTVKNLTVNATAAPHETVTFTVYDNNVAQSEACSMTTAQTTCTDATNTVSTSAGHLIAIKITGTAAGETLANVSMSVELQ